MILRLFSIVITLILGATSPWWLFGAALALYIVFYGGIEALLIAFIIDTFYATHTAVPLYTLLSTGFYLFTELVRPYTVLSASS